MFATDNGFINRSILGLPDGKGVHWLTETGPARIAVLLVNLWLGFPYMFLIATGALQAIPSDLSEAAGLDGAGPWKIFRLIKLPLLLVSLAPLLIASFAYNFNNFTIIYLVTGGGPIIDPTLKITAGGTDILITFVYRIAFGGAGGADYGLASAFSILIFAIIGSISFFSFRRTRALEEVTA
jgi:arabinogalactan oligomer/maltooligosaccharide transport system permease protein